MEWSDLSLFHEARDGRRSVLLRESRGSVSEGEILAVIGQAGVGKTLLLQGLSGHWPLRQGRILFNGRELTKKLPVGSIPHLDQFHYPQLRVRETIEFKSYFRINDRDAIRRRATELLQIFGMETEGRRPVGRQPIPIAGRSFHRTISISTAHPRLCECVSVLLLVVKMVMDGPEVLLLDNPADGLTAEDADRMLLALRRLASVRRIPIVIALSGFTDLHLACVDKVLLMGLGGVQFFYGSPEAALRETGSTAHEVGLGQRLLREISVDFSGLTNFYKTKARVDALASRWAASQPIHPHPVSTATRGTKPAIEPVSTWRKFGALVWRFYVLIQRDRGRVLATLVQMALPFILVVLIYKSMSVKTTLFDATQRVNLLFFLAVNNTFGVLVPVALDFNLNTAMTVRDPPVHPRFLAVLGKAAVYVPYRLVLACAFLTPLYFIVGLRTDSAGRFFVFLGLLLLNTAASGAAGILMGILSPSVDVCQLLAVLLLDLFVLFGGLRAPTLQITWVLRWTQFLSPIYYSFQGIVQNEIGSYPGSPDGWDAFLGANNLAEIPVGWCAAGLAFLGLFFLTASALAITFK
jgi:ABC-type multidrug transport system ATPase subunit